MVMDKMNGLPTELSTPEKPQTINAERFCVWKSGKKKFIVHQRMEIIKKLFAKVKKENGICSGILSSKIETLSESILSKPVNNVQQQISKCEKPLVKSTKQQIQDY